MPEIVNCLSFDIEGFIESNSESFHIDEKYLNKAKENYEIENNTNIILDILSELKIKATFFFVGRIATDIPSLIKKVAFAGHEVACHNYEHLRIYNLKREEFKKRLTASKKEIENVAGKRVVGFRAPDFSIVKSSVWALDILKELGFLYDSSIYPIGIHDVYGISNSDRFIHTLPNGLIEFPLATIQFCKKSIPFGGGGYFRLFPLSLTRKFISRINQLSHPCMLYFHPYEVGPIIPNVKGISFYRKFRHYYNCELGNERLKLILQNFKFTSAIEVLQQKNLIINEL